MSKVLYTKEQIEHAAWYVRSYRQAIEKARQGIKIQMSWAGTPLDEAGLKKEFITALFNRIDTKAGVVHTGRKWDSLYQTEQMRDSFAIQRCVRDRIILRQLATPELKRRFSHLLTALLLALALIGTAQAATPKGGNCPAITAKTSVVKGWLGDLTVYVVRKASGEWLACSSQGHKITLPDAGIVVDSIGLQLELLHALDSSEAAKVLAKHGLVGWTYKAVN